MLSSGSFVPECIHHSTRHLSDTFNQELQRTTRYSIHRSVADLMLARLQEAHVQHTFSHA